MTTTVRKTLVELIGTFFLVFTVICAVRSSSDLAPLGIAAALIAMIYAGGHISGAHFNPAVSIAALVRGRLGTNELAGYLGAQLLGGVLAALLANFIWGGAKTGSVWEGKNMWIALIVEILFTFALAWVVLNVATSKDHPDNSFYGLAIGFTVLAGAVAVGGLSGAAFNPAVALGVTVGELSPWGNLWVYLVAQIIGGVLAGIAFKAIQPEDV